MKSKILLIAGLFIFSHTYGQTVSKISENQLNLLVKTTKAFPVNTELSFGFIENDQVSFYGVKRVNDTIEHIDNSNSVFEIGSITKVFTSTLLANAVLENKIKLNKRIKKYIPYPVGPKKMTVLQLANHTSGLPRMPANLNLATADPSNPYKAYNESDLKEYLASAIDLEHKPGSVYEYSNVGAGILGYLLEMQMGLTYEEMLQKYICTKYEMRNTTTDTNMTKGRVVPGLDAEGNITSGWYLNALVGAGGILSNASDLSNFAVAQFNSDDKALELTRKSTFEIPKYRMEVGLAWNIIQPDSSHIWHMHNGGTGGYSSIMALDIENKNGIIILSNVSAFHKNARNIDQLCLGLMKLQL